MGLAPQPAAFLNRVAPSFSPEDVSRLNAAWVLANSAHSGQLRQSGEPYVSHPLAVAELVYDLVEADADALCAALLHDVVEDSDTTLDTIQLHFGVNVAHIVDGVSKLDQVGSASPLATKEETLRKLVGAGGRDWRVFAVKLCDRLHNMRTLTSVGKDKRRRIAAETYSVFFPLARYVGFHRIATELESLSLHSLYPNRCSVVDRWCQYKLRVDRRRLSTFLGEILLNAGAPTVSDSVRIRHEMMVRCFRRLREDRACRAIFSVPEVFIVCDSVAEAYRRVGELHSKFLFVPASFYSDASEGLVSTKVLLGQRGLVADFLFLFPRVPTSASARFVGERASIGDLEEVASLRDPAGGFTRVLRELVDHTAISVFSPKGRRLSLPLHATGLDFAFAIHTDLGLRAKAVRVNGVLRPASVKLSAGDIVEVIPGDVILARPEWQAALRSPRSRAKLRVWLRDLARQEAVELGRRLLCDASGLREADLSVLLNNYGSLGHAFAVVTRDELFQRIGSGQLSAFAVASVVRGAGAGVLIGGASGLDARSRLLLDGLPNRGINYCDSCKPIPGDEVVAISSFSGAKVHRVSCRHKAAGRASNDFFMPTWATRLAHALPVDVRIVSDDRKGLLSDCARAVANCNIDVIAVTTLSRQEASGSTATMEFTLLVMSLTKLTRCLGALASVAGVKSVVRIEAPGS